MSEEERRLDQVLANHGPVIGTATGDDGAVTVEVEVGGRLRAVRLTHRAMRYGASYLAQTVVSVAARATARANHRAHQLFTQALGSRADSYLDRMGLSYDPALLEDEQPRSAAPRAATRSAEYVDDPADYPETWMQRR